MSPQRGWRGSRRIRVFGILVAIAAVALLLRVVRYPAATAASMVVSPRAAVLDQPVTFAVSGLPAGVMATITSTAVDAGGTTWTASATFEVSPDGTVTSDDPSLAGSYSGVRPMGLFQFMAPRSGSADTVFVSPRPGYDVVLRATVGRRVYATATVRRQGVAEVSVVEKNLRPGGEGVYGTLFLPRDTSARRPGVLVFGSDGAVDRAFTAWLLAAHGYSSLALAYFNLPGLPPTLTEIPLEYFLKAIGILRAQPGVDGRHVLVMGDGRGSEAALLLGAYFPTLVNGVIAGVPSSVVNPGSPDAGRPAWTLRRQGVPTVGPIDLGEPNPANSPQAIIPVERIRGPVLLSCGALDVVWPSCPYTDAITRRLAARHFSYPVTALRYPDAGHLAGWFAAYFSLTDDALTNVGGTILGTQTALADSHSRLLSFLAAQ